MSAPSPAALRRRLAWRAFWVLWGGWTLSVVALVALWHGAGLAAGLAFAPMQIVAGLALASWEGSFRRRHLPQAAHRRWATWLVIIPFTFAALVMIYGAKIHRRMPGSFENTTRYNYNSHGIIVDREQLPPPLVLEMRSRKSNWGLRQRAVRFGESRIYLQGHSKEDGCIIDRHAKIARRHDDDARMEVNATALEEILTDLAGQHYRPGQLEVIAESMRDYLKNRGPLPPRANYGSDLWNEDIFHRRGGSGGAVLWSWPWISAGTFGVLLVPVMWFAVRGTMFPRISEPAPEPAELETT